MTRETVLSKRKLQKLKTRETIFNTALDLFFKKGYHNVSVNEICRQAGISKGSFYYHFKSKDQIVIDKINQIDDYYRLELLPALSQKTNALDKLLTLNELVMEYFQNKIGVDIIKVLWHNLIGPGAYPPLILERNRPLYMMISNIIEEGMANGDIRDDLLSCEDISNALVRINRGIIYDWCLYNGSFDLVKESRKVVLILLSNPTLAEG